MTKVSIVIPIYKVEPYIERCINSVLQQTYRHLEVILIDDCSPDRSMEIARDCIRRSNCCDLEFKFFKHECNRGLSAARNTGTDAATGEYIFYLDSDDEIIHECIEIMVKVTEVFPNVEIVQGHRKIIPHNSSSDYLILKDIEYIDDNNWIREHFYCWDERLPVTAWNKLIKSNFLKTNSLSFKEGIIHEDELWMFHVTKKMSKLYVVKEYTYNHYIVPNSIMSSISCSESAHYWGIILEEIAKCFDEPFYDRQVAVYLNQMINHLDNIKNDTQAYRKLAKRFGVILTKKGYPFLSLSLLCYVYTLSINRHKKGKHMLLNKIIKIGK